MSCLHEFSLRMHTLVCKHASPASKLCSQDMRIACSARMCGRPAAAPYPGLRPSAVRQCERGRPAAVHCPGVRPCKRGEPAAVPYPGVRPRKRGRPAHALLACAAGLRRHLIPASDPLYTTFQKIFTIIRIFLKSEAPKAPGLFTFVHRGGLDKWRCVLRVLVRL